MWFANLVGIGVVAIVSSHIWLLVQVSGINQKLAAMDGLYTKENAKTDFALQGLTDTKQDAAITQNHNNVEDLRSRMNAVQNDISILKNKIDR